MEERNAVIQSASIEIDDHGILTAWLHLNYGNSSQGFGGYFLYSPSSWKTTHNNAGHFIWRVLETLKATYWKELNGQPVRVRIEDGLIRSLGHIIEDRWFNPSEEFKDET